MPQGRRKVPFSSKQKKYQLQQKRERKKDCAPDEGGDSRSAIVGTSKRDSDEQPEKNAAVQKINLQPGGSSQDSNKYRLFFKKETEEAIRKRKEDARKPIPMLSEDKLEVSYEDIFMPGSELDLPKRPPWDYSMSKQSLEAWENRYFREYLDKIEARFADDDLSYFELNLETWRQLWRVLEMSDVVLLITDIRHPVLHFSPALYDYLTKEVNKEMILVLNKVDLAPAPLVAAWKAYFQRHFPQLHVVCFSAFGGMSKSTGRRRKGKLRMAAEGARTLYQLIRAIVDRKVDLTSWEKKIETEMKEGVANEADDEDEQVNPLAEAPVEEVKADASFYAAERYKDGILTIGLVGHPNVGKSSLLNAVMGQKVVSVSRTPGHTKYFQTIFLTPTVRLCDCPGLVFPSKVPKPLQVLTGCYPIAQLREPYSAIGFLAQHVPVPQILKLQHPENELTWSAYDICEAWAEKRGFRTARAARPDVYRAANHILRTALDGRTLCLCFYPPDYASHKPDWAKHEDVAVIERMQCRSTNEEREDKVSSTESSNDSEGGGGDVIRAATNKFALLESNE